MPTVALSYEAFLNAVFVLVAVQDLVLSEVETLAVLGAGGFGKVTLVRYKGERRHCLQGCLRVWVPGTAITCCVRCLFASPLVKHLHH